MNPMEAIAHAAVFLFGAVLVAGTLYSAILTFVLPRGANALLTRWVFRATRALFNLRLRWTRNYLQRDGVMAPDAPWLSHVRTNGVYWTFKET